MRKKKFITHFIVLSLFIFGLGYFSGSFIEKKTKENDRQQIVNKAVKASEDTIRIINNKLMDIENKKAGLNFLYEGLLQNEPSFVFYQISTINNDNVFQPIISAKRPGAQFIDIKLNDVYNLQGQIRKDFINKDNFIIYHREVAIGTVPYGRLFIAFYKTSTIESNYNIYKHIFAFILGIIILGIMVFIWYYQKIDKIKPSILSQAQQHKTDNQVHPVDRINLDELFIPKKDNPFSEKASKDDKPDNVQRNKHG